MARTRRVTQTPITATRVADSSGWTVKAYSPWDRGAIPYSRHTLATVASLTPNWALSSRHDQRLEVESAAAA